MKKILLKYLNLFALSGLLLAFVGCSDDNDSVTPGPGVEECLPSVLILFGEWRIILCPCGFCGWGLFNLCSFAGKDGGRKG